MTEIPVQDRYRNRLLGIITAILLIAALRIGFAVIMPIAFAAIIVAALWPLKRWLARFMPSWIAYTLTLLSLVTILGAFAAAVYLSVGQVIGAVASQWAGLERGYNHLATWAADRGVPIAGTINRQRITTLVQMLGSGVYACVTYVGFIGIVVMLGLPEVPRLRRKLYEMFEGGARRDMLEVGEEISGQIRRYLGTTLATSILTGVASSLWSWMTGLELVLVWGIINFLLNFVPVIGNIVGIVPPVLFAFIQFGGWQMPLLVFAGFVVLQMTISNVVYPILQGKQLSLSPLAIIVAMTFWSWVWGIAGALIAVPLTAAIVMICGQFDRSRWIAKLLSS
ncbi:putative PurR-regulated permease PerM [Sphingomonas sp. BK036]|uniref:AI-2E family transporter n=1 Tax=Sphingomonas sp. BK036 TaxID=2512122 RepID=UPI001028D8F8|nr:AI-2E family transporter [Sphingomonas sp. BK036]RZT46369.1 putative PurR-regulated permease PerM [Sphingomonas sp. BK036]